MRGRNHDDDGHVADEKISDTMADRHPRVGRADRRANHCQQGGLGIGMSRVLQPHHRLIRVGVVIAHDTDERRHGSRGGVINCREVAGDIESLGTDLGEPHVIHQ